MTSPFDPPKCTLYTLSSSQCNLWSVCDIYFLSFKRERDYSKLMLSAGSAFITLSATLIIHVVCTIFITEFNAN